MEWLSPFMTLLDRSCPDPGIPRSLLRQLFEERRIGAGSRVLDVGRSHGELLRLLDSLCLDVSRLDESPDAAQASPSDFPNVTCLCGTASEPLPFPERYFNLILARDLSEHAANLLDSRALCATARLLAAVRPGGILCLVHRVLPADTAATEPLLEHGDHCFRMHLEAFVGDVRLSHPGEQSNWLRRVAPEPRYMTALALVPPEPAPLNEWLRFALKTASRETSACCAEVARRRHAAPLQRSA
jgi:SAM-dependent methyltransferase